MTDTIMDEHKPTITDKEAADGAHGDVSPQDASTSTSHQPAGDQPLRLRIEALLLATDRPLSDGRIAELLGLTLEAGGTKPVREAIDALNAEYEESGRSFRIESVAGGRQVMTLPCFGAVLHALNQERIHSRLSPAALETLAIVAYRQPILRADIEAIRGVACGDVLRGLLERRLVKIVGRAEELGRPMLYGSTREFLRVFGLASLDDLPRSKELREPASKLAKSKKESLDSNETATEADQVADAPADSKDEHDEHPREPEIS